MRTFNLANISKPVSVVGLGTMIFASHKKDLAFELLDLFIAKGGTFVDTAEIYGDPEEYGYSEQTIGMWLEERQNREKIVLMSKGCIPGTCEPIHPNGLEITPQHIHDAIAGSLERLNTDYLDIWMFHRDAPEKPVDALVQAVNAEIDNGRIKAWGGSNWTVKRIVQTNEYAGRHGLVGMSASSPHFSLALANEAYWPDTVVTTPDDMQWYLNNRLPLIAWSSLGRGFFSHGSPDNMADDNLVRTFYSNDNFERKRRARELGEEKGLKDIEVALAYVTNQKFPAIALVGPENKEELLSCIKGADFSLTDNEIEWLELSRIDSVNAGHKTGRPL
jgi:aryl-alcohol dehydrogenase-like predicted oxidoreductase